MDDSLERSRCWGGYISEAIRWLISLWLLAGFFLPLTRFGRVSAWSLYVHAMGPGSDFFSTFTALAISWLCLILTPPSRLLPHRVVYCLIGVLVTVATVSQIVEPSDPGGETTRGFLAFGMAMCAARLSFRADKLFEQISVLGALQSMCAIDDWTRQDYATISGHVYRMGGTLYSATDLGLILMISTVASTALLIRAEGCRRIGLLAISTAVNAFGLISTFTISSILGATIAIFFLIFKRFHRLRLNQIAIVLLVASLVLLIRLWGLANLDSSFGSLMGRLHIWSAALAIFAKHKLFGVGIGNVLIVVKDSHGTDILFRDPLNMLLSILVETGILGLCLYLLATWAISATLYSSSDKQASTLAAMWIACLACGTTSTPFLAPGHIQTYVLFSLLLTGTLLLAKSDGEASPDQVPRLTK